MTGATALPQGRGTRSEGQRIPRPERRAGQRRRLGCRRLGPCDARTGRRHRHDGGRPGAAGGQVVHAGSYEDAHTEMCASCHGPRMPGPRYGQAAGCKETRPDVTRREHPVFTGARGAAVISSLNRGVFAVTAGGLGLRLGHVIYRGVVAVAAVRAAVVSGCCPSFGVLDGLG